MTINREFVDSREAYDADEHFAHEDDGELLEDVYDDYDGQLSEYSAHDELQGIYGEY